MVRITKIISVLLCCAVLLGTTGCAYNSTNPVARYASYGSTYGAVPGIVGLLVAGAASGSDDDDDCCYDDDDNDSAGDLALVSLVLLGAGYVGGLVLGATVGLLRWIAAGDLEPDHYEPPSELYDEPHMKKNWDDSPITAP